MSSKLDYLSKYLEDPSDKKKKDKKKKKRKKSSRREDNGRLVVKDDEEDRAESLFSTVAEPDSEEDEGPVIVNADVDIEASVSRGGPWETVRDTHGEEPATASPAVAGEMPTTTRKSRTRQRYDSSDDDDEQQQQAPSARKRYDSSDDEDDDNGAKSQTDRRRRREDSSSEDSTGGVPDQQPSASKARRRYDSDDDAESTEKEERNPPVKQEPAAPIIKREEHNKRRYDSSDDDNGHETKVKASRRDDDDSLSENGQREKKARMSSGHKAGLQTGRGFAEAEADIRKKRNAQAQDMVDRYGMGETVHRGKEKKTTAGKPVLTAEQQAEINQGKYQKEKAARELRQFEQIQQSEFARRVDDDEVEALRKQTLREGDPMAKYGKRSGKKAEGTAQREAAPTRPVYKGPPPKPNRFGIRPGFRWDGNDRGNGFEDRLLAQRASQSQRREEAYRWSSAAM